MILPHVDNPPRLCGLYVYDFGDWTAVGYTAEEIAILLDDVTCRGGTVYKIHRATPDGRMELRGVSPRRFNLESGMFFHGYRRITIPADEGDFITHRHSAGIGDIEHGLIHADSPCDRDKYAMYDRPPAVRKLSIVPVAVADRHGRKR